MKITSFGRFFIDMKEKIRETDRSLNNVNLEFNGRSFDWSETKDFPINDPWSFHTRGVIQKLSKRGVFQGDFFEAGVGDGRNVVAAGMEKNEFKITGVDLDPWRLELAKKNLKKVGINESRLDLRQGDVISILDEMPSNEKIKGWGIACLPQAPWIETINHADGYDGLTSLQDARKLMLKDHKVDDVGLTLNAAFLNSLRQKADVDFNLLLTLSDRVPEEIKRELFLKTGWRVNEEYRTKEPIQQDPDTGVAFAKSFDDGKCFLEKDNDSYKYISAIEAERRRKACLNSGFGRDSLNVYHYLTVYHLKLNSNEKTVYESR